MTQMRFLTKHTALYKASVPGETRNMVPLELVLAFPFSQLVYAFGIYIFDSSFCSYMHITNSRTDLILDTSEVTLRTPLVGFS